MEKHKSIVFIDYAKCPPCSELTCIGVCPMGVLEAGENNKPQVTDVVSCIRCGVCVNLCPAKAIITNNSKAAKDN
ncbi:MAG: 4Fe-4S dicluster domain-containing protein [Candidatus Bathyarchaeota archaeon]|nr:MAG: 4Fe-4S dicluster domain-containing protein [Candidatus Bathyarchaeota archaeon]